MMNDAFLLIEKHLPECSKAQRKISGFLLENRASAVGMTAAKLARAVGTSESTVVRFAAKLGYPGYPELQAALRESVRESLTSVERMELSHPEDERDAFSRSMRTDIENIKRTLAEMDVSVLDHVADRLSEARRIYILGTRSAASLAMFLNFYLEQLFDDVRLVQTSSGNEILDQLFPVNGQDVVIGISFPRYSRRTVDAMDFSRKKGAFVCAVTDGPHSPLVELADETVFAYNENESFVDSLVAPMAVLNALIAAIVAKHPEEYARRLASLEELWSEYNVYSSRRSSSGFHPHRLPDGTGGGRRS